MQQSDHRNGPFRGWVGGGWGNNDECVCELSGMFMKMCVCSKVLHRIQTHHQHTRRIRLAHTCIHTYAYTHMHTHNISNTHTTHSYHICACTHFSDAVHGKLRCPHIHCLATQTCCQYGTCWGGEKCTFVFALYTLYVGDCTSIHHSHMPIMHNTHHPSTPPPPPIPPPSPRATTTHYTPPQPHIPIVEPHARSDRTQNSCVGTPLRCPTSLNNAALMASVAYLLHTMCVGVCVGVCVGAYVGAYVGVWVGVWVHVGVGVSGGGCIFVWVWMSTPTGSVCENRGKMSMPQMHNGAHSLAHIHPQQYPAQHQPCTQHPINSSHNTPSILPTTPHHLPHPRTVGLRCA